MKFSLLNVERNESLIWGLLLALITSLPYMAGYLTTPENRYYLGFVLNAGDSNTYFMWMSQVVNGDFLLKNLYTSIEHEGVMFNLVFVIGGLIAKLTGSLDIAYQLLRIFAVVFLAWSSWLFIALFVAKRSERRIVFFILIFGAGLGWIWNVYRLITGDFGGAVGDIDLLTRPVDLWVPEGFVFYSMLVMPHFTVAIGCLLLTIRYAAIGLLENRYSYTLIAGAFCFALSFVHPYDVLIALGLSGTVIFLNSIKNGFNLSAWRHVFLLALISIGPIAYNYVILNTNPGMKAWLVQNKSGSPAPWSYIAGYGLLCFIGYLKLWLDRSSIGRTHQPIQWLYAWLLLLPLALYAPIDFQRRLIIAASVPMAVLTGIFLLNTFSIHVKSVVKFRFLVFITIGLLSLTSAFHWMNSFRKATDYSGENFADIELVEILKRISTDKNDHEGTIFSTFEIGNFIPRFTGSTTVIGSRGQTGNFDEIKTQTDLFFDDHLSEGMMRQFLDKERVQWIIQPKTKSNETLAQKLKNIGYSELYQSSVNNYKVFKLQEK